MLKFLDFARLVGAGITCPECRGTRCRQSKWRSKHERLGHIGFRPYRCDDCENRFFVPSGAAFERNLINGAAYALLVLGTLTVLELWREYSQMPAAPGAIPVAAEAVTGKDGEAKEGEAKEGGAPALPANVAATAAAAVPTPAVPARSVVTAADAGSAGPAVSGKTPEEEQAANVKSLNKAASDGHPGAMIRLAQILAAGDKYPGDPRQAAKWMQLAAASGSPLAMYELGRYYRDGIGLPADPVRAYVWFSRAAALRQVDAAHERDKLVRTMSDEKLSEAQVLTLREQ